jgi:hypothetical protein
MAWRQASRMPSAWALAMTWRTRSGLARALPSKDFWANSSIYFSVPTLTKEAIVRIKTWLRVTAGTGVSATISLPVL